MGWWETSVSWHPTYPTLPNPTGPKKIFCLLYLIIDECYAHVGVIQVQVEGHTPHHYQAHRQLHYLGEGVKRVKFWMVVVGN